MGLDTVLYTVTLRRSIGWSVLEVVPSLVSPARQGKCVLFGTLPSYLSGLVASLDTSSTIHPNNDSGYPPGNSTTHSPPSQTFRASTNLAQRLARWLDRPLFPWKKLVFGFSLAEFALENWLLFRQYRVLNKTKVPKALEKEIDQTTFDKSQVQSSAFRRPAI